METFEEVVKVTFPLFFIYYFYILVDIAWLAISSFNTVTKIITIHKALTRTYICYLFLHTYIFYIFCASFKKYHAT